MTTRDGAWRIVHHPVLDSTQHEARRLLALEGPLERVAVSADRQTNGVGRRGDAFESPAGGAWQTLVVRDGSPHRAADRSGPPASALPPLLALTLAEALRERGRDVDVKWPNDLYRGGRKCGGILIERVRGHLLVGVGVDAENEPPAGFARVDLPATEVRALVRDVVGQVVAARGLESDLDALARRWSRVDLLAGRTVRVGAAVVGVACGVAADGALRLRTADGSVAEVRTGRVASVEPPLGPAPAQADRGS